MGNDAYKFSKDVMKEFAEVIDELYRFNSIDMDNKYARFLLKINAIEKEAKVEKNKGLKINIPDDKLREKLSEIDDYKSHFEFTQTQSDWSLRIENEHFLLNKGSYNTAVAPLSNQQVSLEYTLYCLEIIKENLTSNAFRNHILKEETIQFNLTDFFNHYKIIQTSDIGGQYLENIFLFQPWFSTITYDFEEMFPYVIAEYLDSNGETTRVIGESQEVCLLNILYLLSESRYSQYIDKEILHEEIVSKRDILELETFRNLFSFYSLGSKVNVKRGSSNLIFEWSNRKEKELSYSLFLTKYFKGDYN